MFPDNYAKREILNLRVRCRMSRDNGCTWTGKLCDLQVCAVFIMDPFQISPAGIYMFKDSNRNTSARCEIRSKLTTETPKITGFFIVNFDRISHLVLVCFYC